jgi:hypothetical protein
MYQVFLIPAYLPVDYADPNTPTIPVTGSVGFNPDSFEQGELTTLIFTVERTGGVDGACTATIAEGTGSGDIVLNTTSLSWDDQETGEMTGTVDLSSVSAATAATLTLSASGCGAGPITVLDISILDNAPTGCGNNGCIRFGIATLSMDEETVSTGNLRHMRVDSVPASSAAASARVVDTGTGTCNPANYTFSPTTSNWAAGEEGNKHANLTTGTVSSDCTIIFGFDSLSNITAYPTLQTKTITVLNVSGPPPATCDFYADDTGSYGNSGAIGSPYTIGKANDTLTAGQTVCLRTGDYAERINPVNSGTANSPITYTNYNGETATINGSTQGQEVARLGTSYVVLDGLHFWMSNPATSSTGHQPTVLIPPSGNHNQITDSFIVNPSGNSTSTVTNLWDAGSWTVGIAIQGDDNIIDNVTINGLGLMGITINGQNAMRNIIRNSDIGPNFSWGHYRESDRRQPDTRKRVFGWHPEQRQL